MAVAVATSSRVRGIAEPAPLSTPLDFDTKVCRRLKFHHDTRWTRYRRYLTVDMERSRDRDLGEIEAGGWGIQLGKCRIALLHPTRRLRRCRFTNRVDCTW